MSRPMLFLALAALAVALAVALWLSLPAGTLSPAGLQSWLPAIGQLRQDHPVAMISGFFLLYLAVAALSLPVAVWLTLAAGALFGWGTGLVVVSFASSIGATLAFLAARHLLRGWVEARLGDRVRRLRAELDRDGAAYLFSLRLVPVVPFVAVNLMMGLTAMPAWRFYLVSQLGMLPATAVYINAGTQLARLDGFSDILSPAMLLSFGLLAAFPWLARVALSLWRRRRVLAGWRRPARFDRNLVVIGAGAAGLVAANVAASARASVTLVEAGAMGGECLNSGCVPSKALIRSATLARRMRDAGRLGLVASRVEVDFPAVMARLDRVIAAIAPHDSAERYRALGVEVIRGRARLADPWTVEIAEADGRSRRLTARAIILATGARPALPPVPGLREAGCLTSETLWDALRGREAPPRRLAILGGGPVGVELAQALARLGSKVTLIESGPRLLGREEPEVSTLIRDALTADGVEVLTGQTASSSGTDPAGRKWIALDQDGGVRRIVCDEILVAAGRTPRLDGLGLETLGIDPQQPLADDDGLATRFPHILIAGDATGPPGLTHMAGHQGWHAAMTALFGGLWRGRAERRLIPQAIFTDPEIARAGLTGNEAARRGVAVEVTRFGLDDLDRAIADDAARGFVRVLTRPGSDRILGVTIAGAHAGEMIAEFVLAMRHGLGLKDILGTIHIYPTMSEANARAAAGWRRARLSPRLLALAERFHQWRRR